MYLIFNFALDYILAEANINAKLFSLDLTSIQDFTVQGKIPEDLHDQFVNINPADSSIKVFKEHLIKLIRSTIEAESGLAPELTEVVDIRFSFFNKVML